MTETRRESQFPSLVLGLLLPLVPLLLLIGCSTGSSTDYSRTPVVFVHGHGMHPTDWDDMMRHLSKRGYPPQYLDAVNIHPNVMGNIKAAESVIQPAVERLFERVRETAREVGYAGALPKRVDIVSHSMGAVSSRWYTAMIAPERVRLWISLGGANHGTNTLCDYQDEGAAEMCPAFSSDHDQNMVQLLLNGTNDSPVDETPWGLGPDPVSRRSDAPDEARSIAWYTLRIEPDKWIEPGDSAILHGAGSQLNLAKSRYFEETSRGNLLLLTDVIHDDMPRDEDVIDIVTMLLGQEFSPHD